MFINESRYMSKSEAKAIREALLALPKNYQLAWGDDSYRVSEMAHRASWIDVYVPEICAPLGLNWLLSVYNLNDEDDNCTISTKDFSIEGIHSFVEPLRGDSKFYYDLINLEIDGIIIAEWDNEVLWHTSKGSKFLSIDDIKNLDMAVGSLNNPDIIAAWSYKIIESTLNKWVYYIAGRDDIKFKFSNEITTPLIAELDRIIASDEEEYLIGEGIVAKSSALDSLLKLDDDSSIKIMKELNNIKNFHIEKDKE